MQWMNDSKREGDAKKHCEVHLRWITLGIPKLGWCNEKKHRIEAPNVLPSHRKKHLLSCISPQVGENVFYSDRVRSCSKIPVSRKQTWEFQARVGLQTLNVWTNLSVHKLQKTSIHLLTPGWVGRARLIVDNFGQISQLFWSLVLIAVESYVAPPNLSMLMLFSVAPPNLSMQ